MTEKELIKLEQNRAIDTYRRPFLERLKERCPEGGTHIFEDGECIKCGEADV